MFKYEKNFVLEQVKKIKAKLDELYAGFDKNELKHFTVYIPVPVDEPKSKLNRISAYAPAIAQDNWPKVREVKKPPREGEEWASYYYEDDENYYDDTTQSGKVKEGDLMKHVFSIDLHTIPKIKQAFKDGVDTLSFFISSLEYNNAYFPKNGETEVMLHGVTEGEFLHPKLKKDKELKSLKTVYFDFIELQIPELVFWTFEDWNNAEVLEHKPDTAQNRLINDYLEFRKTAKTPGAFNKHPVSAINGLMLNLPAYIGGSPVWLQGDDYLGFFIMQFYQAFVDISMGDSGIMYVFADTAFWQGY